MDPLPLSLADRIKQAVEREARKAAIDRWNALIARGAIDPTGRVLLKAPKPMKAPSAKQAARKSPDGLPPGRLKRPPLGGSGGMTPERFGLQASRRPDA